MNTTETLVVDGTIGTLSENLNYVNITFYPTYEELEFMMDYNRKEIYGEEPVFFYLEQSLSLGEIVAVDINSGDQLLHFKHFALYRIILQNNTKKLCGYVNKLELKDNNPNTPILQIAFAFLNLDGSLYVESKENQEEEFPNIYKNNREINAYSIENVWITGFSYLTSAEKQYVLQNIKEGNRVYLRNEFDNPVDPNALLVLHNNIKIGYVQQHKRDFLLAQLRNKNIGGIEIARIDRIDINNVYIDINVYYKDKYGEYELPHHLHDGKPLSIVQKDIWSFEIDWIMNWHLCSITGQLCYKFRDLFGFEALGDEDKEIESKFDLFISHYLDGSWITKETLDNFIRQIDNSIVKNALKKQIDSYMESMSYRLL